MENLPNFADWFSDPAKGALALAFFVAWVRSRFPRIDGKLYVALVTAAIGMIGGAAGQSLGFLSLAPFAGLTYPLLGLVLPLGGMLYGLTLAAGSVTGVSFMHYVLDWYAKKQAERAAQASLDEARKGLGG
jgi:hypothetical protein